MRDLVLHTFNAISFDAFCQWHIIIRGAHNEFGTAVKFLKSDYPPRRPSDSVFDATGLRQMINIRSTSVLIGKGAER